MTKQEQKFVCDLISLVGDAVATGTIPEAEDYLMNKYAGTDNEVLEHTYDVLSNINKKLVGSAM